jgi:tetratricopeptide (TPR) repeat protein
MIFISSVCFGQTKEDYLKSGDAKAVSEDYEGAILDYTKAIELNPNDPDAYYCRGEIYQYDFEQFDKALDTS